MGGALQTVVPQAFTGTTPFGDMEPILVVVAIAQGRRPQRPAHPWFTGKLWRVINRCWDDDPQLRPEAPEVLQALRDSSVSHSFRRLSVLWLDCFSVCRNPPAWKRLINPKASTKERVELIKFIFSDRDEGAAFEHLSEDDAQAFVDVIDEVSIRTLLLLKNGPVESSAPCGSGIGKLG